MIKNYFIKQNYTHRESVRYHDDTKKSYDSDKWKKEVYILAKKYAEEQKYNKIHHKISKYFQYIKIY